MKILVTGGAGFIGCNFIYYMLDKYADYEIVCLDALTYAGNLKSLTEALKNPKFKFVKGSISDKDFVDRFFKSESFDIVVNFAAESHVDRSIENPFIFLETNIMGTACLLEASKKYGVKRYHQVSTDEVYGDLPLDRPDVFFTEKTNLSASSPYSASKASASSSGKQSLISVNLLKLDQLHDIVGEIITTESMVISNPELNGLRLESFSKAARELRKLTDELQDTVMSIRMVPLTGTFQKMNRIVRDMKVKLGKDAELVIEGDTTEVDKSIVDNLNDPLMHLVRNCMDHGIEDDVNTRISAGKPEKGTVKLSARHSAGEVIITVSDDGAGINCAKVLEKAKKNGILTKPENEYTTKEIQNMILLPGFSTNDTVTEYSGRGVGMDVVRSNIEQCGGTLNVESEEGKGSSFIIRIPLTLAIVEGMKLKVGDTIFTVPISSIKESLMVANNQLLHDTKQGEMIMIRGVCYPILRLHEKFNMPTEVTKLEDGILLLVDVGGKNVCLFADKLIGEQPVVVKPFPKYLSQYNIKAQGLSGCTVMGDGTISLIIDVNNLIS